MISLGLDLSLTGTGVVLLGRDDRPEWKHISTPAKMKLEERFYKILCGIDSYADVADVIVIESPAMQAQGQALTKIFGLNAVVRYDLWEDDKKWVDVAPTSLKKFVTGNGRASKADMIEAVAERWGFHADNDDIADAYGLAVYGIHLHQKEED